MVEFTLMRFGVVDNEVLLKIGTTGNEFSLFDPKTILWPWKINSSLPPT